MTPLDVRVDKSLTRRPMASASPSSKHVLGAQLGSGVRARARYVIGAPIAAGGMGTVHFGIRAATIPRLVAVKKLHPHFAENESFLEMFLQEAALTLNIRHPNVCATLDVLSDGSGPAIVMEYVHGVTLSLLYRKAAGPIPAPIAASIMHGVLLGLHAAHEAKDGHGVPLGIVHRDVSPQNVLVGADGIARLIDFGVARCLLTAGDSGRGLLPGKLSYMAPERLFGQSAAAESDIFAAAIVLWELLAGRRLYRSANDSETIERILMADAPRVVTVVPDVPSALDAVLARGLAREVRDRYRSALAMAEAVAASVPLATVDEVEEWVGSLAADELDARAALAGFGTPRPSDMATTMTAPIHFDAPTPPEHTEVSPPWFPVVRGDA